MKYLLIFGLLVGNLFSLSAQKEYSGSLIIYPTYSHYERDSGIVYEGNYEYWGASQLIGKLTYSFKTRKEEDGSERKKASIVTKDIWGFRWGEALYRISPYAEPMYVVYAGKVVYYEVCDYRHVIEMVTPITSNKNLRAIKASLISETLNSTLYAVRHRKSLKKSNLEGVNLVLDKQAKGRKTFNCLLQHKKFTDLRECIQLLEEE